MSRAKAKRPAVDLSHGDLRRGVRQAYPRLGVPDDMLGFRRLSEDADRDLPALTQDRMLEIAYYLWQINPLARWLIETNKDFVVGEGIRLQADDPDEDEELQDLLDALWYDPINHFPLWSEQIVRELALFGEQCWPVFTDRTTGRVRLACVDPVLIQSVLVDPDNARIPIGVVIKKSLRSTAERTLRIIYDEDDAALFSRSTQRRRAGMTDGECFYHGINALSTASRGTSDLLYLFDWLDGYDQFLFDMLERVSLLGSFVWDVLLRGADDTKVREFLAQTPPPRKGSIRAHNENVEWNAVAPDLKMTDNDTAGRMLRNQILGGAGYPEHWYGGGGDVNRATAAEMGEPTYKRLRSRQTHVGALLERVADYQITQAVARGQLRSVANPYAYSVILPELVIKDLTKIGSVIASLASALAIAKQDGLIDEATAQRVFAAPVAQLGVEVDLADLAAKVAEEQERRAAAGYFRTDGEGAGTRGGGGEGERGSGEDDNNQQARRGRRVPSRYRRLQLARKGLIRA